MNPKNDHEILSRITSPYTLKVKVYDSYGYTEDYRYFDVLESYVNIDKGYANRIDNMLTNKNTMKSYNTSDWETH